MAAEFLIRESRRTLGVQSPTREVQHRWSSVSWSRQFARRAGVHPHLQGIQRMRWLRSSETGTASMVGLFALVRAGWADISGAGRRTILHGCFSVHRLSRARRFGNCSAMIVAPRIDRLSDFVDIAFRVRGGVHAHHGDSRSHPRCPPLTAIVIAIRFRVQAGACHAGLDAICCRPSST